ncbi:probable calcium-binding protein CML44 [Rhodamnia argentea]|uniref:Probable calcium-binding protein CML44 n=1 Tax=Rhodamnia argentea TaxID=178133 RepID=A0A8B8QF27_9MYRT|nr:probable calcium-binding protein CML44 [Rhodamnia argentea]
MPRLGTGDLRRIFENLDKNGDGQVSLEELNWLLEKISVHHSVDELELFIGKPSLDFDEFLHFYVSISWEGTTGNGGSESPEGNEGDDDQETDLAEAFKVFDLNNDGFISCDELQSVLSKLGLWNEGSGRDCNSMIRAYDTDSDGRLDFEEFKSMMLITFA